MPTAIYELPYDGAKEMLLVEDVDNKKFLTGLFNAMYDELPAPKPKKKKMDCSGAEFLSIDEGLCVQIMHIGAFDDEPATVAMMDKYLEENGYVNDFTDERRHHEIYLSDPRKVAPEKCKTVIRHPIKKA